ncbi:Coenzyme F420 hydrogenase/dehydrogenase, beta subunit C-terminal domain [Thermodesulfobacteriota bacterium]
MENTYTQHLEISKQGFSALQRVIDFSCSRCGLCSGLCPKQAIQLQETIPTLTGECNNCGLCYQACPRSFFPRAKAQQRWFGPEKKEFDQRLGCCTDHFTSRALTDEIYEKAATGGTTTALLHYLLDNKIVDAVLHLESIHKDCFICHHARTRVSTTPEQALLGAKSKNQITPILHDLEKVSGYNSFAVVGLSCHVEGIRKLQIIKDDPELRELFKGVAKIAEKRLAGLKFVIGINCFSATKYGGIDKIYARFGIKEADVIKYAEDTKKTLYQVLNEGKTFSWFVQDNIMTRQGKFHPFHYVDFLEEVIPIGCMVCPSFIVSKMADVSIGVTASETKLTEFGYNSIFVRHPELKDIFNRMASEEKLLKRPMLDSKGKLLRKFVERVIPAKDLMNFEEYVKTGTWNPSDKLQKGTGSAQSGAILGLQRLLLAQTVKKKLMYGPAVKALQSADKHSTDYV